MIKSIKYFLFFACLATLFSCGQSAEETEIAVPAKVESDPEKIRQDAVDIGIRAATWQLNNINDLDYIPGSHRGETKNPRGWVQGAFFIGLLRFVDYTNERRFNPSIEAHAESAEYMLGDRDYHGDDHLVGQKYIWLYEKEQNPSYIAHTQEIFDKILENKPSNSLEFIDENTRPHYEGTCQDRWCWADALFMAPRTWIMLSNVTGDPKYLDYANSEYWDAADYLFSKEHGLFFRDSRYFEMKSDNGQPVFWGRGNGWVYAALPMIIDELPKDFADRDKYIELYKDMSEALVKIQKPDGNWAPSLLDPDKVKTPETSGTGFIMSGIAWGVNNGILEDEASKQAVLKGWDAITKAVKHDGRVTWVQMIGKGPDPVKENESQLYGVGAVLLAAAEMSKWQGN